MHVTDAREADSSANRMKAAGPAAAAIGIVTTLLGVSLLANSPEKPATPSAAISAPPASAPSPGPDFVPGLPQVQFDQTPGASAPATGIEVVVKFKDDSRVKDIIDAFWRDQASAKAKFDAWKSSRPDFAKLKLDRVTYSNELVLVHDGSAPAAERLPAMKSIVAKLEGNADISYAEPNMTAQPGGQ